MSDLDVTASLPEAFAARLKEFTNFLVPALVQTA